MTTPAPTYDLMLMLDPEAEEAVRAKIVTDARSAIEARGELLRHDEWGDRALAYPIDRKAVAEYHLLQFDAGTPELLSSLERTLKITDGIIRFRIIKLRPGVPEAPDVVGVAGAERHAPAEAPNRAEAEPATAAVPGTAAAPGTDVAVEAEGAAATESPATAEALPAAESPAEAEHEAEVGEPA
jgi:small subunit ribosomal protein S6